MKQAVAYDDAVDLLEADHKAVKKLFMAYGTLCEDQAPAEHKGALAHRICQAAFTRNWKRRSSIRRFARPSQTTR